MELILTLNISFSGSQKNTTAQSQLLDIDSIQGAIEAAFLTLKPFISNKPNLVLCGR